jgi:hypothetical protein
MIYADFASESNIWNVDDFVPFPTLQRSPQSELHSSRYDDYKTDT